MATPPTTPDRLDLLERLQTQQLALNDLTRQALATLDQALGVQQRSLERYGQALDRHAAGLETLASRQAHHEAVLERLTGALDRLNVTMQAIQGLLPPSPNGQKE